MNLALKVDVDTYDGMRHGVPNLLNLFRELKIQASFFVPFGPDESGKAVFRIFKKKGFLKKMFRTNALKLYGIKTALRGTLLPAPMIGSSFPEIVRDILKEGHELGIHGYNHVLWQDHLLKMSEDKIEEQFKLGISAYRKIVGEDPNSFAAPAWLCSATSLKMVDKYQFSYASDTRGKSPFFPVINGNEFKTIQLPSTLPTLDELIGLNSLDEKGVQDYLAKEVLESNLKFQIHSIHTEVEGTALFELFSKWLIDLRGNGVTFLTLNEIAKVSLREAQRIPKCEVVLSEIPGRAGLVSCQGLQSS